MQIYNRLLQKASTTIFILKERYSNKNRPQIYNSYKNNNKVCTEIHCNINVEKDRHLLNMYTFYTIPTKNTHTLSQNIKYKKKIKTLQKSIWTAMSTDMLFR